MMLYVEQDDGTFKGPVDAPTESDLRSKAAADPTGLASTVLIKHTTDQALPGAVDVVMNKANTTALQAQWQANLAKVTTDAQTLAAQQALALCKEVAIQSVMTGASMPQAWATYLQSVQAALQTPGNLPKQPPLPPGFMTSPVPVQ